MNPVENIHAWLHDHEDELLRDTIAMLRIPSVKESPEPEAPYGVPCKEALDFAMALCSDYGFATKVLDGKIGYGEVGSGDPLIVSLGHLDVVPVGPGWKHGPFSASIDDGYLYCRGSVDDKGPTMAAFFAVRAVHSCFPDLDVRFRIVFGCDEESGMTCVERYTETEEQPTFGVAPDSSWPLVHAEKGIADLFIDCPVPVSDFQLTRIEGGQRLNIVIDSCGASIRVSPSARSHVDEKLANSWDRNVEWQWASEELLEVRAIGKAAHGAKPWLGDNAATRLFRFLAEIAPLEARKFYSHLLWAAHPSGVGIGIHGSDPVSKDLTSNLGIVTMAEGAVRLAINVRYPVTWQGIEVRSRCEAALAGSEFGCTLAEFHDSPSLYFPVEHPLVATILGAVEAELGVTKPPGVMGGGTYARKISNTVSIGTGWFGDGEAHQTDERLKVEHLYKMSRIYGRIFYELALAANRP